MPTGAGEVGRRHSCRLARVLGHGRVFARQKRYGTYSRHPMRSSTHCCDTDQVTHENADVGWSKRRDYFMQKNPNVDVAEVELLISLLRRMLATEPEMRPSADEVLTHPWFAEGFVAPPDGPSPELCEHDASVKR